MSVQFLLTGQTNKIEKKRKEKKPNLNIFFPSKMFWGFCFVFANYYFDANF